MTEDPEESKVYSKHADALRSLDDGGGNGGNTNRISYDDMIAQSKGDN